MQVPPLVISLAFGWRKYARSSIRTFASSSAAHTMAQQCGRSVESKYDKTRTLQGIFEPPFRLHILLSCLELHSPWMAKASDSMLHTSDLPPRSLVARMQIFLPKMSNSHLRAFEVLGVEGRLCGRRITQCSVVGRNLCMGDVKQHNIHT